MFKKIIALKSKGLNNTFIYIFKSKNYYFLIVLNFYESLISKSNLVNCTLQ